MTSPAASPRARSSSPFSQIRMARSRRPKSTTEATPWTVSTRGLTWWRTYSLASTTSRSDITGSHSTGSSAKFSLSTTGGSTSLGRRKRAWATLSRTSWAAMSISTPSSNSTTMKAIPCVVSLLSERTPATVFRYSSRTSVTSCSTTSGLAPSSTACTVTIGNSRLGKWSTPRR